MILLSIAVVVLFLTIVVMGFVIWNLLKKVETYEEDIITKDQFMEKLQELVTKSEAKIKTLDMNGAFEADDEVGYFFKSLKDMIFVLGAYFNNYNSSEKEEK